MIVRYYPSQEMNTIRRQMGTRPTTWTPAVRLVEMATNCRYTYRGWKQPM